VLGQRAYKVNSLRYEMHCWNAACSVYGPRVLVKALRATVEYKVLVRPTGWEEGLAHVNAAFRERVYETHDAMIPVGALSCGIRCAQRACRHWNLHLYDHPKEVQASEVRYTRSAHPRSCPFVGTATRRHLVDLVRYDVVAAAGRSAAEQFNALVPGFEWYPRGAVGRDADARGSRSDRRPNASVAGHNSEPHVGSLWSGEDPEADPRAAADLYSGAEEAGESEEQVSSEREGDQSAYSTLRAEAASQPSSQQDHALRDLLLGELAPGGTQFSMVWPHPAYTNVLSTEESSPLWWDNPESPPDQPPNVYAIALAEELADGARRIDDEHQQHLASDSASEG
jgi:hypothetical protein